MTIYVLWLRIILISSIIPPLNNLSLVILSALVILCLSSMADFWAIYPVFHLFLGHLFNILIHHLSSLTLILLKLIIYPRLMQTILNHVAETLSLSTLILDQFHSISLACHIYLLIIQTLLNTFLFQLKNNFHNLLSPLTISNTFSKIFIWWWWQYLYMCVLSRINYH